MGVNCTGLSNGLEHLVVFRAISIRVAISFVFGFLIRDWRSPIHSNDELFLGNTLGHVLKS